MTVPLSRVMLAPAMQQERESLYTVAIYQELMEDALAHAGLSSSVQRMKTPLGGTGFTVKNCLVGLVRPEGMALRLSADDQRHLLTIPGSQRLSFPEKPAHDNQWVLLPEAMLEQPNHFASWLKKAWKYHLTCQVAGRPRPKGGGRKGR